MHKVKVYSSENCHNCITLKEYLTERNIEFDVLTSTERANRAYLMTQKVFSVPYTEITMSDGAVETMLGFDKEKLDKIFMEA